MVGGLLAVLAAMFVSLIASACDLSLLVTDTAATSRSYGRGPVQAIADAAEAWVNSSANTCGVETVELAAVMITPTLLEAGDSNPSPMTLSRWDNIGVWSLNRNLFAFGNSTGAYTSAFFSPGIGLWQFDSAGGWDLTAAEAIDVTTAAPVAARTMGARYCGAAAGSSPEQRRIAAWSPWSCDPSGYLGIDRGCEAKYDSLLEVTYEPDRPGVVRTRRLDFTLRSEVSATGGMQRRTCSLRGVAAPITCYRIDPALAEGSNGWANWGTYDPSRTDGVTPVPKPFYSFRFPIFGRDYEFRVWMHEDTGYPMDITALHPVTDNARTSIAWKDFTTACDEVTRHGACGQVGPVANLDSLTQDQPAKIRVAGWAFDRDTDGPIAVRVNVDGTDVATITANGSRPDVGIAYPGAGDSHGFTAQVPVPAGQHSVCFDAVDVGGGTGNLRFGCRSVTVSGVPQGSIDVVTSGPGRIAVTGWTAVPSAPNAPAVVSVDGTVVARATRTLARADVANLLPWAGATTGFNATIDGQRGGSHRVCLTSGLGAADALGCRTVTLPTGAPIGSLDVATAGPGSINVGGWAIDPDTAAPIAVHVYLNASGRPLTANAQRADVGSVFPAYGAAHGFSANLPVDAKVLGANVSVCAYGIDVGGSVNTLVGCRSVRLPTGSPIGSIDVLRRTPQGVSVAGWAIDPDTRASIPVHVYVGSTGTAVTANGSRPDVGAYFRGWGDAHGYATTVPIPAGPTQVCVYAIESAGTGGNVLLGCRTV